MMKVSSLMLLQVVTIVVCGQCFRWMIVTGVWIHDLWSFLASYNSTTQVSVCIGQVSVLEEKEIR